MCQGEKALRRFRVSNGGQIPVLQSVSDRSSGVEAAKGVLESFVAKLIPLGIHTCIDLFLLVQINWM